MKKIVVTGGTGFIGSHLVPFLAEQGYEVHILQRNESKKWEIQCVHSHIIPPQENDFLALIKEIQPEGVIHLATYFQASHKTEQIKDMISANVTFGCLLLQAVAQLPQIWFLNIGTFWQHINAEPYSPVNLYAATKQAFEDIAAYYAQMYPINFLTLCLNDTYGPGDRRLKIFNIWKRLLSSEEPLDMTAGEQILDILYITDVTAAIKQCISLLENDKERKLNKKIVFASSAETYTLRQIAELFEQTAGKKLKINWGKKAYRPKEIMVPRCFGIPVPGWKSKVSLESGIKRFIENE